MKAKPALSALEQDLLRHLWRLGSPTASELQAEFAPARPLQNSTVRTLLTRLEEKGYLRRRLDGRAFRYSSVEPPQRLAARAIRQIVDRFCHGSVESLLVGMVDHRVVDVAELRRIAARLSSAADANSKKQPAKRNKKE